MQTKITNKGQVTIPRNVRQHFRLRPGMAVTFAIEGDYIALRPVPSARQPLISGFGLIQSPREGVPVDFFVSNPYQGYCMAVAAPKVAKFRKTFARLVKD